MAKVEENKSVSYTLTLSAKEAFLLKAMLQNVDTIDPNVRKLHQDIFEALPSFDVLIEESRDDSI